MAINSHINPQARRFKKVLDQAVLISDIKKGDVSALSRAITLLESTKSGDQNYAQQLIKDALPYSGDSFRLGITGVPGVGKSTFIESLGKHLLDKNFKIAILAIDPSSSITRGSILGDKTRMEELVRSDQVFIRPSPAGNTLGGVARATREAIILCEAAGYNFIIVETVGVGQSETAVHSMTDFFLLLKLAGAGDDLQGIKRGIMEMADAVAINKADGDNDKPAQRAAREFKNAMHLFPAKKHGFPENTYTCSGLNNTGLEPILEDLLKFKMEYHLAIKEKRKSQSLYWLHQTIKEKLTDAFYQDDSVVKKLNQIEMQVTQKKISPFEAANSLYQLFKTAK